MSSVHPVDRVRVIERFEAIPRLALGHYPTPLEKMPRLRAALGGGPRLFIKRDDYTGPGFGGNKVRKLEYVLAAAQRDGADAVITCGGERSNHCRITAMLAAKLGLECVLVLNRPSRPWPAKPASLALDQLCGARIVSVGSRTERGPAMEHIAEEFRIAGRRPCIIPLGASTPLGAMGYVAAAAEVAAQLDALERKLDAIFVCSSSGGTHAGLAVGAQLFLPAGVLLEGVSPDDPAAVVAGTVAALMREAGAMLGAEFGGEVTVIDDQVGAGYGIESPAGREALELLARTEGIVLDPVYTAKAMAALVAEVRKGRFNERQNVLFWHTGGQMALFDVQEKVE